MSVERLQEALGHRFSRTDLLRQALTHRSHGSPHNERLEFLGDAVLNCVVAALLFDRFPDLKEGDLSRHRANLVRQPALADIAFGIRLGDELWLGDGELKSGGANRPSILADGLEAVIGAVYLDGGFDAAHRIVESLFLPLLNRIDPTASGKDAKTALQEVLQGRRQPLPIYSVIGTRGEAHAQTFEVECNIPAMELRVSGSGSSRRSAEQAAAQAALDLLPKT